MMRPAATEETPCNLCGAADYGVVGERDRDGRPLRTVMCRRCGLVWTNPRPPAAAMDAYYASTYRADYTGSAAPPLRKILRGLIGARERRRALAPWVAERSSHGAGRAVRVLDVGCGAGELVYLLRHDGLDAAGLEPGREYGAFAREVLGIPVQIATVGDAVVAPASQDLVTMFHALEHVPDPRGVLATVRTWVTPGGFVVVEVPNVESTAQAPAHRFHYAHLYSFTGATLGALGEAAGLRVVRIALSPDGGNVTCVFRRDGDDVRLPDGLDPGVTRARLAGHTPLRHYLSSVPYRRIAGRLARRRREDRLLQEFRTVEDLLRWATSGG
jgi:2-polyprenyl-3-methyl-5-hydroxy-6-metoxy-1,4-benzoquinol methylase